MLHSVCQQIWKTQQWPQDWKRSVFIPIPKKGNAKECSNYLTIALISHSSKVMLKILQARLQQYVNHELPDVQAGFRKGRGTRDQIANICCIIKKAKEFQENIYFCFIDYARAFYCVDHKKLWEILKEMGIPYHHTCPLRNILSRFVIAFLPRSKCLLISSLQLPSTDIWEPNKIRSATVSIFSHLFAMK